MVSVLRKKKLRRCLAWAITALAPTAFLVVVAAVVLLTAVFNQTGEYFIVFYLLIFPQTRSRATAEVSGT